MIPGEWAKCRDWLVPALEDDTEDHVIAEIDANRAQLWRGEASAIVTQLVGGPEPYVLVWLGGGDLFDLFSLRPGIEAWARMHGAKAARINGRKDWVRPLARLGFEPDGDELRKVLS